MSDVHARASRLRSLLPVLVSAGLVAFLVWRIDPREVLAQLAPDAALRFALPLVLWNAITLAIEAQCLHRVTATLGSGLSRGTAARIKSACYLLSLLHYAAGATALALLIQRRTGSSLARAGSAVFVIALLDLASVCSLAFVAGAFLPGVGGSLRFGLLLAALLGLVAGFALLRAPISLGPLDRLRDLELLRGLRTAPAPLLFELAALRGIFVACYVGMTAGLFWAFGVEIALRSLALKVAVLLLVSTLPIAVAGIGTAQIAFVSLFAGSASEAKLLSMSILLSASLVLARAALGLLFAGEFGREARDAIRTRDASA